MTNIRSRFSNKLFTSADRIPAMTAAVLIAFSVSVIPAVHAREPMQLRTADREVFGTRELESGNYAVGIQKSESALARTVMRLNRSAILTNLCVATIATG